MADLSFNSDDMSQIEKEGVDLWKALMRAKQGTCAEKESLPECSFEEKPILNSRSCSVSGSKSEGSVISVRRVFLLPKFTRNNCGCDTRSHGL